MSIARKPRRRVWSRREYYRMADNGMFTGQRVELIEGEVIAGPAQKGPHVVAVELAEQALESVFGSGYWVRVQAPLHLGRRSAPEPDLAVVLGQPRDYATLENPSTALLVVEVSDRTLSYDRGVKASLYASAGILDYWIVDLVHRRLEVRRNPVADDSKRSGYSYSDLSLFASVERVSPLAAPHGSVAVSDLLP